MKLIQEDSRTFQKANHHSPQLVTAGWVLALLSIATRFVFSVTTSKMLVGTS
jgi:hypothetical protein